MAATDSDASVLLMRQAAEGDESAVRQLLGLYRGRLRRMVAVHLDERLATRVDPSDVVQEALLEASQKLPAYLKTQPLPFYPWLRQIAWQRLVHLRQRHLAQKRSVLRESRWDLDLSGDSVMQLANRFVASGTSPSQRMIRSELNNRVRAALDALSSQDRQALVLRYLEQLSTTEAAQVLGITEEAFMKRHVRAIQRLRRWLDGSPEESP